MTDISPRPSSEPFDQCPSGCVCGVRELVAKAQERGPRDADDVDAAEMRALLTAVRSGYEAVRSDRRLVARRHALSEAHMRAERELNTMRTMLDEQRISRAAAAVRQALDVAEKTGRHRAPWLRRVRWPTVIAIGLFDTWYFYQVFKFLTAQTGDGVGSGGTSLLASWEALVALVPGVALGGVPRAGSAVR
jgi:hypothetical protein